MYLQIKISYLICSYNYYGGRRLFFYFEEFPNALKRLIFRYYFQILVSPVANGLDDRCQFLADVGQVVLDFWGNNRIDRPGDDQVALQFPQLTDQHPLVDVRKDLVELAQPQLLAMVAVALSCVFLQLFFAVTRRMANTPSEAQVVTQPPPARLAQHADGVRSLFLLFIE